MEKRYFVLKKGYLNINDEFFYFNDHGNWETCKILEETENPKLTFFYVSNYVIKIIYAIIVIAFLMAFFIGKVTTSFGVLSFGTVLHFLHRRYKIQYFKIPIHKIKRLLLNNDKLTIEFANSKNHQIKHTVKLDDKTEAQDIKDYLNQHFNHKLNIA